MEMKKKRQQRKREAQCIFAIHGNEERTEERIAESDVRVVCCRQAAPDCLRETLIILNHLMTKQTSVVCACVRWYAGPTLIHFASSDRLGCYDENAEITSFCAICARRAAHSNGIKSGREQNEQQ